MVGVVRELLGYSGLSLISCCNFMNSSRQNYYQYKKRLEAEAVLSDLLLVLIKKYRKKQPHLGGRKLLYKLRIDYPELGKQIGRDRLFSLLKRHGLLVVKAKKGSRTTNSYHRFTVYDNLIKELKTKRIYEVLVGDITYIRTLEGFMYLALLTDLYSRKIVGWDVSDSLELTGCWRTLQQALKVVGTNKEEQHCFFERYPLIHHSDRGIQYCSYAYTDLLKSLDIHISMAAKGNCYENAVAERVNGILKMEFELKQTFRDKRGAKQTVKEAVQLYNEERPHLSLKMATPSQVFERSWESLGLPKASLNRKAISCS